MSFLHEGIEYLHIPEGLRLVKIRTLQSSELVIPDSINNKPVIEIWNNAFSSTDNLKKITLPSTIFAIRTRAFWNCVDLEEVICNQVGYGQVCIHEEAFANCRSLKRVSFFKNMELTGNGHFCFCENLLDISWVTGSMNTRSFYGCGKLKKLYMCGNLTFRDGTFNFVPHLEVLEFKNAYVGKYPKGVLDFMKERQIICDTWSELKELAYQGYHVFPVRYHQ